jgi:hypothetical protein
MGSAALAALMAPEEDLPRDGVQAKAFEMYKAILTGLKPTTDGPSMVIRVGGFATFADLAAMIKMELREAKPKPKAEEAKVPAKLEKR